MVSLKCNVKNIYTIDLKLRRDIYIYIYIRHTIICNTFPQNITKKYLNFYSSNHATLLQRIMQHLRLEHVSNAHCKHKSHSNGRRNSRMITRRQVSSFLCNQYEVKFFKNRQAINHNLYNSIKIS